MIDRGVLDRRPAVHDRNRSRTMKLLQRTTLLLTLFVLLGAAGLQAQYDEREAKASEEIQRLLGQLRETIDAKAYGYTVGYTEALDHRLEQLSGTRPPSPRELLRDARLQAEMSEQMMEIEMLAAERSRVRCAPVLSSAGDVSGRSRFNWRDLGKVTAVRNQSGCGSCWAFAAVGALESSFLIRNGSGCGVDSRCLAHPEGDSHVGSEADHRGDLL
jgi:cathepsin L